MKKNISAFLAMILLTVLLVGARNLIMKIELKDGSVRYIDTESVNEFNIIELDDIPQSQATRTITETMWEKAYWLHNDNGFFGFDDKNASVLNTYVPNDPVDYDYTIKSSRPGWKAIHVITVPYDSIYVPAQATGFVDKTYGAIWVTDNISFARDILKKEPASDKKCEYLYDGSRTFNGLNLQLVYYAPGFTTEKGEPFHFEVNDKIVSADFNRVEVIETTDLNGPDGALRHLLGFAPVEGLQSHFVCNYAIYNPEDPNSNDIRESVSSRFDKGDYDLELDLKDGEVSGDENHIIINPTDEVQEIYLIYKFKNPGDDEYQTQKFYINQYKSKQEQSRINVDGTFRLGAALQGNIPATLYQEDTGVTENVNFSLKFGIDDLNDYKFTVPDMYARDENGYITVTMASMPSGYVINDTDLYVADVRWYCKNVLDMSDSQSAQFETSVMDPATNSLRLNLIYYTETQQYGYGFETFTSYNDVNPFLPQFSMNAKVENSDITVSATIIQGNSPIEYFRIGFTTDSDVDIVNNIRTNPGNYTSIAAMPEGYAATYSFAYEHQSVYQIAMVAYDRYGNEIEENTTSIATPADMSAYNHLGKARFVDAWILPLYQSGGQTLNAADYEYEVDIYQDKSNPEKYILQNPWVNSPLVDYNASPELAELSNLELLATADYVIVKPQESGYSVKPNDGGIIVMNREGYEMDRDTTLTPQVCVQKLKEAGFEQLSTFKDGVITIPSPLYTSPSYSNIYSSPQAVVITLPSTDEQATSAKHGLTLTENKSAITIKANGNRKIIGKPMIDNTAAKKAPL